MMLGMLGTSYVVCFSSKIDASACCIEVHTGQYGYCDEDIVMLTDDAPNPRMIPTKDNIVSSHFFQATNQY